MLLALESSGGLEGAVAMLQPRLSGSEGSGYPQPWLGLRFPRREAAAVSTLGSAHQECESIQCPMLHSPFCPSDVEKTSTVPQEDKRAFGLSESRSDPREFWKSLDFGVRLRGQFCSPPASAASLTAKSLKVVLCLFCL